MIATNLTRFGRNATGMAMIEQGSTSPIAARKWLTSALVAAGCLAISGCVTVNAPEDAIVIELNINIQQEVIYRLAADAGRTIEDNADIF
ncbi:hypothetical protein HME9302_01388 [Alteripontixanthobacter maritimus]|uniref:YnbE-like lipoprotein n=1 Tax=Alteripontixanthobacter maritimus TaxID=2161824 RepID=A0A369QD28_9SPHN|nr:YnbE family lipoprotein [Alteripontixanthobacter maritimus]RDC60188.1 hypothetical protein HME9302_01388 [Alteripontixanthobacter maritimus]